MSKQVQTIQQITQFGRLKLGQINLDLTTARIISANAIQNTTEGGVPDGDTAGPALGRVNAAVDKALRLSWAATQVNEIQFAPVPLPVDLDPTAGIEVHLLCAKNANANTVTIDVQVFFGVGDTECGAVTDTIGQALAEYKAVVAAADVPAPPNVANVSLIPSAHAGDALYVYAAWIQYTRKA